MRVPGRLYLPGTGVSSPLSRREEDEDEDESSSSSSSALLLSLEDDGMGDLLPLPLPLVNFFFSISSFSMASWTAILTLGVTFTHANVRS